MEPDPHQHHRHSIRLPEYDYSQPGAYFITVVTLDRVCLFGEIKDGKMHLNEAGNIVWGVWNSLPDRYPQVSTDAAVVMPNHFHGIVRINDVPIVGVIQSPDALSRQDELPLQNETTGIAGAIQSPDALSRQDELPLQEQRNERRRMTLPLLVGYFKMNTAKRINQILGSPGKPVWQKNYYEHIIRNDDELNRIDLYIEANIDNWAIDEENPLKPRRAVA